MTHKIKVVTKSQELATFYTENPELLKGMIIQNHADQGKRIVEKEIDGGTELRVLSPGEKK